MMYLAICILAILGTSSAQIHGAICHSNHLQHTEDEVIEMVASTMDTDGNGHISKEEVLIFFADLMGIHLGSLAHLLAEMSGQELLDIATGFSIEREAFTHAWYTRFHDSKDFIRATFDVYDTNDNGVVDAREIEGLVALVLHHGDEDRDGLLAKSELVIFLEQLYKHCD